MGNERGDLSKQDNNASRAEPAGKDDLVVPGSPPPLGSERTDVSPGSEAGVDELPNNDGATPRSRSQAKGDEVMSGVPDIDPDSAELDDAPNPR